MKLLIIVFISFIYTQSLFSQVILETDTNKVLIDTAFNISSLDYKRVPSVDTLFMVAKKYLGKHAHLFVAIKIIESGNTNKYSWLALKHNNLCGMRFPKNRKTYAISKTNSNYAIYRNWFESILDFKIYIHLIEKKYLSEHKNTPSDVDLINYMSTRYNHFDFWKTNMLQLIKMVHKKYD
ncbi:MAG: hypothetical protein Q8K70_09465 [Bacteroidota bacterium]|nr:hypothetical protein [Bacteroidota bacterium]